MTLTEDELARLAGLEDLLTVGLVEQPINGSVLSWGEAALIAHRIGRHLLRVTPVADTAGIDAERLALAAQRFLDADAAVSRRRPSHPQARGRPMTGTLSRHRLKAEAEDYAQAIRNEGWIKPDWQALNARLIDEFGLGGLVRIKRAAWKLIEAPR